MDDKRGKAGKRQGEIDRRRFLSLGGKLTFGSVAAALILRSPVREALAGAIGGGFDDGFAPLDGACFEAETDEERVVAAIVDTVVPSAASDPSGAPGALDCCALNLIYDAFYPFVDALPILLPLVDGVGQKSFNKDFVNCDLEQRTEVLRQTEESLAFLRLAYRFIRSAFYGATYTMRGTRFLQWPGPNLGYRDHPEFTFGVPVSEELTEDGNLP